MTVDQALAFVAGILLGLTVGVGATLGAAMYVHRKPLTFPTEPELAKLAHPSSPMRARPDEVGYAPWN